MLERGRNTVARRGYDVVHEGRPEAVARFRRLRDAEHEARVRACLGSAHDCWLVVRTRRGERTDVIRRIDGGAPPRGGEGAGDRSPRRPRGPLGSGAAAVPLPED